MIEIKNLSHTLGNKTVLKDISLTFSENKIFGLLTAKSQTFQIPLKSSWFLLLAW